MKKISMILAIFSSFALCAGGDFDGINEVINEGHQAGQTALGVGLIWLFSGLLIIFPVGGAVFGYMFAKKKAEQQQEGSNKMAIAVIGGIVGGAFAGTIFIALCSQLLLGDSSKIFTMIWTFLENAMQTAI